MKNIIVKRILIISVALLLVAIDATLRSETEYDLNPIMSPLYWIALYLIVIVLPKSKKKQNSKTETKNKPINEIKKNIFEISGKERIKLLLSIALKILIFIAIWALMVMLLISL
tara:strand:+ start:1731 stop:2072 length:342 start_codon:yes stop_codon:yes gene_type:complete